MKKLPQYRVEC